MRRLLLNTSNITGMNNYCMSAEEIDRRFNLHTPDPDTSQVMDSVRSRFKRLAGELSTELPACRETSLAYTKLEEALYHSIAALARDGK